MFLDLVMTYVLDLHEYKLYRNEMFAAAILSDRSKNDHKLQFMYLFKENMEQLLAKKEETVK